jgi:ArsR family transcriptional regulator, arsenate/arsenite/antimonite-responsive transcriptional repressor / arsenate reductase (thioredoxin)
MKRILFLCNGNSARSQMAEAFLRHAGSEYFEAFSAGTKPAARVHPLAIETLRRNQVPAEGLAPKDVSTFSEQQFDFVISLCDREHEQPAVLQGADMIYWTFPDPAEPADEAARARAFEGVFRGLERRIRLLIAVNTRRNEAGRADRRRDPWPLST